MPTDADGRGAAGQADVAWPLLDPSAVDEIAAFGSEMAVEAGQVLTVLAANRPTSRGDRR